MDTALEDGRGYYCVRRTNCFNPHSNGYCSGRFGGASCQFVPVCVSILILMDTALEDLRAILPGQLRGVSILILMDTALEELRGPRRGRGAEQFQSSF